MMLSENAGTRHNTQSSFKVYKIHAIPNDERCSLEYGNGRPGKLQGFAQLVRDNVFRMAQKGGGDTIIFLSL